MPDSSEFDFNRLAIIEAAQNPHISKLFEASKHALNTDNPNLDISADFRSLAGPLLEEYYGIVTKEDADLVFMHCVSNRLRKGRDGTA